MSYPEGDWHLQERAGAHEVGLRAATASVVHPWWFPYDQCEKDNSVPIHGNAGGVTHRACVLALRAIEAAFDTEGDS